mmetsp:Transcript_18834/g.71298  ORF Transcript_18834/g.71298 Transcript_18834/m.71298 type:complete len:89 (-) Transcript_18834:169-435(-)
MRVQQGRFRLLEHGGGSALLLAQEVNAAAPYASESRKSRKSRESRESRESRRRIVVACRWRALREQWWIEKRRNRSQNSVLAPVRPSH